MTFLEIKQELARETNKNASALDATSSARFGSAINRHYRRLASLPGLQHLRDTTTTFDSAAGQALYQIEDVAKIKRIFDPENRRYLEPMSMVQYRMHEQDADNMLGTPSFWIWRGQTGGSTPTFDLYLWPTPSAAITYTADITSVLTILSADGDVPILPGDFHDLLFLGALIDEYRHLDDPRVQVVQGQFGDRERQFKLWMHETDAGSTCVSNDGSVLPSRLGAWFPAGS